MKHKMTNKIHEFLKLICFVFTLIIAYINGVKFNTKTSCNNCVRKTIQIVSNIISSWNKSSSLVEDFFPPHCDWWNNIQAWTWQCGTQCTS